MTNNCDTYLFVDYGYFRSNDTVIVINQSFNLGEFSFDSCLKSRSELISLNMNLDLEIETQINETTFYNNGMTNFYEKKFYEKNSNFNLRYLRH
jgi:hypothetical protein